MRREKNREKRGDRQTDRQTDREEKTRTKRLSPLFTWLRFYSRSLVKVNSI